MFSKALIIFGILNLSYGGIPTHRSCNRNVTGQILQIRVDTPELNTCHGGICRMHCDTPMMVEVTFRPAEYADSVTRLITTEFLGVNITIDHMILQNEVHPNFAYVAKKDVNVPCLLQDQSKVYEFVFEIINTEIDDTMCCAIVDVIVIPPVNETHFYF